LFFAHFLNYFKKLDNFLEPVWIVNITSYYISLSSCERVVFLLYIARWLKQNECTAAFVETVEGNGSFFFSSPVDANNFSKWIDNFVATFKMFTREEREQVWLRKTDFFKKFEEGQPVRCDAVVTFEFASDDDPIQIELWIWFKDSCEGQYWRDSNRFFFEKESDAIAFKLTWIGEL
jgi:hypothetical protein